MNPYQFLKELNQLPPPGGDGYKATRPLNPIADLRTAAGLVLTAGTTPAVVAVETNFLAVQAAASSNVLGSFVFHIPRDYDEVADVLELHVLAQMGGATDVPTLGATAYRKREAVALSSVINATASAALAVTASSAKILLSGKGLKGGDSLTINLTSAAHTTDAINIYSVSPVYKSALVFTDIKLRS